MGLDRPGISARPTKRKKLRRAPSLDDERRRSSQVVRATTKPRKARKALVVRAAPQPKAGSPLKPLAAPKGLALPASKLRTKQPKRDVKVVVPLGKKRAGGAPDIGGVARVLGHAIGATAESVADDPVKAARKTISSGAELAKGAAGVAVGLPLYAAKYTAQNATGGAPKGDQPLDIVKRLAKGEGKYLSSKYGPSYRGEKGAYKRLKKRVGKEGPLLTALDVATAVAPVSSGLGKTVRAVDDAKRAAGGKPGRVAAATRARPKLKTIPLKPGVQQQVRPSAVGAAGAVATDALRRGAQKAATARSTKRLRVRAVQRVTGKDISRARPERKPRLLNTQPKPLTARRADLARDEVAPLTRPVANRRVRMRVTTQHTRGEAASKYRIRRLVSDPRGDESIANAFRKLPEELHHAALKASELGIRGAQGARNILPLRIREAEANRTLAATQRKHPAAKAEAHAAGDPGELDKLKALLAHPEVFDDPRVIAAAERLGHVSRQIGGREGLSPGRAALGRSELVGSTLGVKTVKQQRAELRAAHVEGVKQARRTVDAAKARVEKAGREAGRQRLVTREAAIGGKLGGRVKVTDPATLKAIVRNEQKRQGKQPAMRGPVTAGVKPVPGQRRAMRRLGIHGQNLPAAERELLSAKGTLKQAREDAKAARIPPKRVDESPHQYEARVAAASKDIGLAPPEYVPSLHEQANIPVRGIPGKRASSGTLTHKRKGILYALGREDTTPLMVAQDTSRKLHKGATMEAESRILAEHGLPFRSPEHAAQYAKSVGLNMDDARGAVEMVVRAPSSGKVAKTIPGVKPKSGEASDFGNYVKTDDVFLMSKTASDELDALQIRATKPPSILQKLAQYPQAALLALSPSWFQFQRVNDLLALTMGGALPHVGSYNKMLKQLTPDEREIVHTFSGGSLSSTLLKPTSLQELGRLQRVMDNVPLYQRAFRGQNPATALLRADQAITGRARELQLLHNLSEIGKKLDPDVSAVARAFAPIGQAFKTADVDLVRRLLNNPKYQAQLEDAAQRLYKIHGDWHNYTAREQALKSAFSFYGFLRYATRMALFTLPIQHPYMGMLIAQLGHMGAEDAKRIIGPDIPYGLGVLYNKKGTIASDLTRANPLAGPLTSITKPENMVGLLTPLAGISLNYLLGQNIAFNDSTVGRAKQLSYRKDPSDTAAGVFSEPRLRYGADQLLGLLSPYREWKKFDPRQQTDDSLAWDRRIAEATGEDAQAKILKRNARTAGKGGVRGTVHDLFPMFAPGSEENIAEKGKAITQAKQKAAFDRKLKRIKRNTALHGFGALDRQLKILDAQLKAAEDEANAPYAELDRQLKLLDARLGK